MDVGALSSLSIRGAGFFSRLEKHIQDFKRGRGELSKEVGSELRSKDEANSAALSTQSPSSLAQYSAYLTAFSYDKRARFIHGVSEGQIGMDQFLKKKSKNLPSSRVNLFA